jgi:hypothetical protein
VHEEEQHSYAPELPAIRMKVTREDRSKGREAVIGQHQEHGERAQCIEVRQCFRPGDAVSIVGLDIALPWRESTPTHSSIFAAAKTKTAARRSV